jgi:integrase/recombinase XerD
MAKRKGLRDLVLIALLYDSESRVQEITDLTTEDIRLNPATVKLKGKGKRTRIIPIAAKTVKLLGFYLKEWGLFSEEKINYAIFLRRKNYKLTRDGINYILFKYLETVRKDYPKLFPKKV